MVVGDNKINIFTIKDNKIEMSRSYEKRPIRGHIIGIEDSILYILDHNKLTLMSLTSIIEPKFIEEIEVPFEYKLGTKTNGRYITRGSDIIDIKTLRVSKKIKLYKSNIW